MTKHPSKQKHLDFVRSLPCAICHYEPAVAHHLLRGTFARGWGMKAPDEKSIPLCDRHHRDLHMDGNEIRFLTSHGIEGEPLADRLFEKTGDYEAGYNIVTAGGCPF